MAAAQPSTSTQEYTVRVPKSSSKKCMIMKFNPANNVDFTKSGDCKIERENNLRAFKLSHDIDQMPKFGAGSEFGREQKEEARRKKYGVQVKHYNPADQPWLLKMGSGKQARKFKGTREGGVQDNASYYIFTQCSDGAFEAHPVNEWYNFTPVIKYKYLNSEEAEEEFNRRDKTINYFSIMLKKRLKNVDGKGSDDLDEEEGEKKGRKGKAKRSSLKLTEMEDWESDESEDDADSDAPDKSDDDKPKKKKTVREKSRQLGGKVNSDNEALEESDSMDEGQEVDYMTDSDSDDEGMYDDTTKEKTSKYDEKGVEDEDDLRKMISSGEEDEEEEKQVEEEDDGEKEAAKRKSESDSESSSSSESDPEKDADFASALFMQKGKKLDKRRGSGGSETSAHSRPVTPSDPAKKRKHGGKRDSPVPKKSRSSSPINATGAASGTSTPSPLTTAQPTVTPTAPTSSDGITEDSVKRYLMRKPMTTTDLVQKFRSKHPSMSRDKLVHTIAQLLKRINPHKETIKEKLYLSIKAHGK